MKTLRCGMAAALPICVLLLASCGGGGGGGGGDNPNPPVSGKVRFTADKTTLTFDLQETVGFYGPQTVTVTASGDFNGTLYVAAVVEGDGIDPNIPLSISGLQGTFTINPAAGLSVGDYSGRIKLMGCSDANCSHQVGNSPIYVNYTTHVHSALHLSAELFDLATTSDKGVSRDVTVTLPWQQTSFMTQIFTSGPGFLTITQPTPTTLHFDARPLPSGTYNAAIQVSSGGFTRNVTVNYVVTPPPGGEFDLRADPNSVSMSAIENTVPEPFLLHVLGPTWAPDMATTIWVTGDSGTNWLTAEPAPGGYRLVPSPTLRGGHYSALLYINPDPTIGGTQISVPVSMTVGGGLVKPADVSVLLDANTTLDSPVLHGSIPINLVAGAVTQWKATGDGGGLVLTRDTGATGTNLEWVINPAQMDLEHAYMARDDVHTVTLGNADGSPPLTPVTFTITVQQRLAHVNGISPNYTIGGRASRHIVRGSGFIANRDWSRYLQVQYAPAGAGRVTRVNDNELVVDVDAFPSYPWGNEIHFNAVSALAETPAWDPVRVQPVRTQPYVAIETGFPVSKLIYDHPAEVVRLLDENGGLGAYHLYNTVTDHWIHVGQALVGGLKDAIRTPDHGHLLVATNGVYYAGGSTTSMTGTTLETYFNPVHVAPFADAFTFSSEYNMWFSHDDGTGHGLDLAYLSYPIGGIVTVSSPLLTLEDGPWFTTSGNGERVYISQTSNPASTAKLLAFDAAYNQLFEVPNQADPTNLREASINMDGSRLVGADYELRNLAYQPIGQLTVPDPNFQRMASAINPDGTRAYVLAYDLADIAQPIPAGKPRVYVYDITAPVTGGQARATLGYFTLNDFPGCLQAADCPRRPRMTVADDGETLYLAGNLNLVIAPLPNDLALQSANAPPRLNKQVILTHPWHLNLGPN